MQHFGTLLVLYAETINLDWHPGNVRDFFLKKNYQQPTCMYLSILIISIVILISLILF